MKETLGSAISTLVILGLAANAYCMLTNRVPDKLWWWPPGLTVFGWAALPFAGLAGLNRFLAREVAGKLALLAVAAVVTAGELFILIQAFAVYSDPQSGLVFVFLPFYQLAVVGIGMIPVAIMAKCGNKETIDPPRRKR